MSYRDVDDGHRIGLTDDVISHSLHVFEQGLQLEAILLAHEYLEQELNLLYRQAAPNDKLRVHRKFKPIIDLLGSRQLLGVEDYATLNEFNRLRNVNAHQILDSSLVLRGAKKGDMIKTMDLAQRCNEIISRLNQEQTKPRKKER